MHLAVKPILATNDFLRVVAKLIAEKIAAPRAKIVDPTFVVAALQARIVELSVVAVEPLIDELP
jgi:hypothetical protein